MSGKNYKKGLRRDITVAFLIKIFLISLLIFAHKYYKKSQAQAEEERYPIFQHTASKTS